MSHVQLKEQHHIHRHLSDCKLLVAVGLRAGERALRNSRFAAFNSFNEWGSPARETEREIFDAEAREEK